MFFARVFFALTVSLCTTLTTQAMSRQPLPVTVSYAVGAHTGAPVIYTLTVNGSVLHPPGIASFGAARVPPVGSGAIVAYVPRLSAPNTTKIDIKVEWTEIWSGQRYQAETLLNTEQYPWFEDEMRMNITFEQNGGLIIRLDSEELWEEIVERKSSGPLTLDDYIIAFDTCAPRLDGPSFSEAEVREQLNQIWAADIERLEANRDSPLPPARCSGFGE
ncbi:hypothetical protein [Tritonibacter mobilis]|uniref:hypothetical protein n=1 Tax=Tritonibacter mobilis TaxID=379347 RepID=UPI0008069B4C|nr:hypothetical protein [Tritonibacter mobilis]